VSNNRFDLPARNSIPVNEPGSAAYRRLQRAKKGRPAPPTNGNGWKPQPVSKQPVQAQKNVQRRIKGK